MMKMFLEITRVYVFMEKNNFQVLGLYSGFFFPLHFYHHVHLYETN